MNLKSLAEAVGSTLIFSLLADSAFADMACTSGNLSTIDGTTCDIGNLRFTFSGLASANSFGSPWTDSNFTFAVLSNGFQLSGPPGQEITAAGVDYAALDYSVTALTGEISSANISTSNTFAVSGPNARVFSALYLCSTGCARKLSSFSGFGFGGSIYDVPETGPISSGSGAATPFSLSLEPTGCCTASISGTTTDFTFSPGLSLPPPPPVPEPRLLTLLSIGFLCLVCAARRKLLRQEK